ncbi:MAG: hypothetical protein GXY48_00110 [Methanomicrobiales archaeon]|nr:hypothetical protein [Methanomicrobiales archaeon]
MKCNNNILIIEISGEEVTGTPLSTVTFRPCYHGVSGDMTHPSIPERPDKKGP